METTSVSYTTPLIVTQLNGFIVAVSFNDGHNLGFKIAQLGKDVLRGEWFSSGSCLTLARCKGIESND